MVARVISSGTVAGLVVSSGQEVDVVGAGVLADVTVVGGGRVVASAGGVVRGGTVSGDLTVGSGGQADKVTIASGGQGTVRGNATSTQLLDGANFDLLAGGTASGTIIGTAHDLPNSDVYYAITAESHEQLVIVYKSNSINSLVFLGDWRDPSVQNVQLNFDTDGYVFERSRFIGGYSVGPDTSATNVVVKSTQLVVSSGASVSYGSIENNGSMVVLDGATVRDVTLGAIASIGINTLALRGGTALHTAVRRHSTLDVYGGGYTSGTSLSGTASLEEIHSGGAADRTTVRVGGLQIVETGGFVSGTNVYDAGTLRLSGGSAYETILHSGGIEVVHSAGMATRTSLGAGGHGYVSSGGTSLSATVLSDGLQIVVAGGTASAAEIMSGGTQIVNLGATVFATEVMSGGIQVVEKGGIATKTLLHEGGLVQRNDFVYDGSLRTVFVPATDILTIYDTDFSRHLSLAFAGDYAGRYFHLSRDAAGGTEVTVDRVPCFVAGTLILTDRGERPVQALTAGDRVVTASGATRRVRWLGRRSFAGRFLAANPGVQPVRFRAGSLGDGLPRRDLCVSPDHAMFLDDVLVPAGLLVNGTTIVRDRSLGQVDYHHVELDRHDVLLAEGAPTESFVDDDSRGMFHNAAEWDRPRRGRTRAPVVFCAPRVDSGPDLLAIRRRLDAVAGEAVPAG